MRKLKSNKITIVLTPQNIRSILDAMEDNLKNTFKEIEDIRDMIINFPKEKFNIEAAENKDPRNDKLKDRFN